MAATLPYTYFQCPCTSDTSAPLRKAGELVRSSGEGDAEDERNFDPRAPRSNYSLYPLEYLLYCEDCQQIRCPRCVLDEIVIWYCPNCLFETPSSTVKSEGNRCTRSCFQCPICMSPLSVSNLESSSAASLSGSEQTAQGGPWVLNCGCCNWSSTEIGIKFEKPNSIYSQLSRIRNGGGTIIPQKERRDRDEGRRNIATSTIVEEEEEESKADADDEADIENRFSKLKQFYQSQLAETSASSSLNFSGEYGYGSPGALSRIMGLYTGGSFSGKKTKAKTGLMREAYDSSEGLLVYKSSDSDIKQLQEAGWAGTASREQRDNQPTNPRFISELRPVPYLLRTKRSKRCRTCRHILSKPEAKVQITRFRIRLVAGNYIPSMTIKPLSPPVQSTTTTATTAPAPTPSPAPLLTPLKPTQFLLTVKNPLFDPVKITLATPSHTPGRFSSKITILCPQFEVGANTDVWDEALQDGTTEREKKRMTRDLGDGLGQGQGQGQGQSQAEAGKVWEKGRNWISVVVEVVPASLRIDRGLAALKQGGGVDAAGDKGEESGIAEDEDILEIPVFVRVEWETDPANDDAAPATAKEKEVKEKRELAYWCVLGVGKIVQT